ncbi:universal stress protein [Candidatus Woesearchaeota archaeon]|nr:universal stress protein [Candidatus Woesearchaeota archaeon]
MYSRVLVCVSNPRHIAEMTRLALSLSGKDLKIIFLRIASIPHEFSMAGLENDLGFLKKVKLRGKPIEYEKRVVEGENIKEIILDVAREEKSELIVLGSNCHKNFIQKISDDISTYVMRNAKCAVVLVKSGC